MAVLLVGCGSQEPAAAPATSAREQTQADQSSGGDTITPLGTTPNAPVGNASSVTGSGSGVGQSAKDAAKRAAGNASAGSLNQATD